MKNCEMPVSEKHRSKKRDNVTVGFYDTRLIINNIAVRMIAMQLFYK